MTPADTMDVEMEMVDDSTAITFNPERARELAAEGDALFAENNFTGAMDQYTLGLEYDSTYAKNPFGQARTYVKMREYPKAVDAYRLAIQLGDGAEGMTNVVSAARTELEQLEANLAEQQSAQALADKISRATTLLQSEPVTESAASTAYDLLEETRVAGYDSSQVAFYYAKALNTMGNYSDATHYAQLAVDQSEGQPDRSAFYIQLGLAHKGADNAEAAREAFNMAKEGAWSSWAEHYLNEMESDASGG